MIFILCNLILFTALSGATLLALTWGKWERLQMGAMITLGFIGGSGMLAMIILFAGTDNAKYSEIWNYKVVSIKHTEEWTVRESRTREVSCGTDKKGNTKYRTETYYVTEHYGPYWNSTDEYGDVHTISQEEYDKWAKIWGNSKVVGHHKGTATLLHTAISGDIFQCVWAGDFDRMYPFHYIRNYVNKVRATKNIWSTAEPDAKDKALFTRPADVGNVIPIVSYDSSGSMFNDEEKLYLERKNCIWGPSKQMHLMLVIFNSKDSGIDMVARVLNAWQGPNKNELCVFMGLDADRKTTWIQTVSWMDDTTLHALINDHWLGKRIDVKEFAGFIDGNLKNWKRKSFKDFDYIRIEICNGAKIIDCILQILLYIGYVITLVVVLRDNFSDGRHSYSNSYRSIYDRRR